MSQFKRNGAFSDLLKAVFCPICGAELGVEERDGKRKLVCVRHGFMEVYLPKDPKAEFSSHCDAVGVVDVEGC